MKFFHETNAPRSAVCTGVGGRLLIIPHSNNQKRKIVNSNGKPNFAPRSVRATHGEGGRQLWLGQSRECQGAAHQREGASVVGCGRMMRAPAIAHKPSGSGNSTCGRNGDKTHHRKFSFVSFAHWEGGDTPRSTASTNHRRPANGDARPKATRANPDVEGAKPS